MAIARDNSKSQSGSGSSLTVTFTCTGANRIVFVAIEADSHDPTGITYDGVAMTRIDGQSLNTHFWSLWYLIAPSTTTNANVVASYGQSESYIDMEISSYTGVKQTLSYSGGGAENFTHGVGGSPFTTNLTTINDNSWTILFGADITSGTPPSASTGSSLVTTASDGAALFDSNAALSPAGGWGMTLTWSANIYTIGATFSPAVAASTNTEWSHPTNQPSSHWNQNIGFA